MQFRRHRRLLNLIDHLPGNSAFGEAYANDPKVALDILEGRVQLPKPDPDAGPPLSEWSPVMEGIAQLRDLLNTLIAINVVGVTHKKAPQVKPAPRPRTAVGEARQKAAKAAAERDYWEIVAQFTPDDVPDNLPDDDAGG